MGYTNKQKLFADYMLRKIGMSNQDDINTYLSHLETLYGRMVSYPSQKHYSGSIWHYSVSDCIDQIKQEVDLKKIKHTININGANDNSMINATDLANYNYCPASYAIGNSFQIENQSGIEFTEIGKQLHEQLLAVRTNWFSGRDVDYSSYNDLDADIVNKSRLIFTGHQDEKRKFVNGIWVGVPDYIFQDKEDDFFVVEEKFHRKRDPNKVSEYERMDAFHGGAGMDDEAEAERNKWREFKGYFFSNHIIQIVSYIRNIKEYRIAYGYLLYWYYDIDSNSEPYIHKVVAKKIILNEETENLYIQALQGIEQLRAAKQIPFTVDTLNMKKCAGCVVNKYCGHKTRRFENLTFPYNLQFLNLYSTDFPEELKRTL